MDPLSVLTIPHILQGAAKAISFAWHQYSLVEEHKDRCKLLLERCQEIIVQVAKLIEQDEKTLQGAMTRRANITVLESTCLKIQETIAHLASKSFIWRILHQSEVEVALRAADCAVIDAYSRFNMGSLFQLETRIEAAVTQDQSYLASRLQTLERNDEEILGVLQTTGLRVEELFVAFMKFTQNPRPGSLPAQAFIQKAATTLKRLSNAPDVAIPRWSLTSLEVEFDRTNKASCIGRGRFGSIYRGQWDGLLVAVKEMHVTDAQALDETQLHIIRREIRIWSGLTHPHVLPFYGACLEAPQPFMVSKLCTKGNALQYLRQYPDADRISLMFGIALGMTYLHRKGIIHADIKALNILIGDDGKPLIADFGLSKIQDQIASTLSGTASHQQAPDGTLRWLAPERLDGARLEKPSDVYSFGITAWELFAEAIPFADLPDRALLFVVVDRKKRPERPLTMTNDSVWTLVQQCWDSTPSIRPTFDSIRIILQTLVTSDGHQVNEAGSSSQSPSTTTVAGRNGSLPSSGNALTGNVLTEESLVDPSTLPGVAPPLNLSTSPSTVFVSRKLSPARPSTPVLHTPSTGQTSTVTQLSPHVTDLEKGGSEMAERRTLVKKNVPLQLDSLKALPLEPKPRVHRNSLDFSKTLPLEPKPRVPRNSLDFSKTLPLEPKPRVPRNPPLQSDSLKTLPEPKPRVPRNPLNSLKTLPEPKPMVPVNKRLGVRQESSSALNPGSLPNQQLSARSVARRFSPSPLSREKRADATVLADFGSVPVIGDEPSLTTSSMNTVSPYPQEVIFNHREITRKAPLSIKCVLVGDGDVEKAELLTGYANTYPLGYVPTVFDNYTVTVMLDEEPYQLSIFDTSGQEDYDRLRPLSYPLTDVFLIGFNVTSQQSFRNVEVKWFSEVTQHCPGVPFLIFGTHVDERENVEVVRDLERLGRKPIIWEQGKQLADKLGAVTYVECSAVTGEGVKNVFDQALVAALQALRPPALSWTEKFRNIGWPVFQRSKIRSDPLADSSLDFEA